MSDPFYPSIPTSVLEELITKCSKIIPDSKIKVGDTTAFVLAGNKALHKRFILLRELEAGEISFEIATGIAIRLGVMGELIEYLTINKGFKEGGYTQTVYSKKEG